MQNLLHIEKKNEKAWPNLKDFCQHSVLQLGVKGMMTKGNKRRFNIKGIQVLISSTLG